MKSVAIVGYDVEGEASYEYYKKLGIDITICDIKTDKKIPVGAKAKLGPHYLDNLDEFDLIIRTPGLHPDRILEKNPSVKKKIHSATNEFFKACPTKNIIAVTGTKGKGTTSSLIHQILKKAGKRTHIGGNIGIPMLGLLGDIQEDDWVVLELSNFQLIDFEGQPKIAVCLMVVPEHLDWHRNVGEYYDAKKNLFKDMPEDSVIVYNGNNYNTYEIIKDSKAQKIIVDVPVPPLNRPKHYDGAYVEHDVIYFKDNKVCAYDELTLRGRHNLQNVCSAVATTWDIVGSNKLAVENAIKEFEGLEHRLEFVGEVDGITFVNDSFATTPLATVAAMQSYEQPKVMILGGSDKGIPFNLVIEEVLTNNIRHVIAIGKTGKTIATGLRMHHYPHITEGLGNMEDIVATARDKAKKGDVVLLSCADASFDMFDNYKDRGNQFRRAVQDL